MIRLLQIDKSFIDNIKIYYESISLEIASFLIKVLKSIYK